MLISVIVPVYNEEKYLPQCIESILNQTYKDLELILVDDGSTDQCPEIMRRYAEMDNRVVLLSESNSGAGTARNLGLSHARGAYVTFIDCDDWIADDCLEFLIGKAKAYMMKGLDAVICGFHIYDGNKSEISTKIDTKYYDNGKEFFYRYLIGEIGGGAGCNSCKLLRREFLQDNHLQYRKFRRAQDGLFNCETRLYFNSVLTVSYYGYYYRVTHAVAHEVFWSRKDPNFYFDIINCVGMNIEFTRQGLLLYDIHEKQAFRAFAEFQIYELNIMGKRIGYDGLKLEKQIELNRLLLEKYTDKDTIRRLGYKGIKWKWLNYIIKQKSAIGLFFWVHVFTEISIKTWKGRILRILSATFPKETLRGKTIRRAFGVGKRA